MNCPTTPALQPPVPPPPKLAPSLLKSRKTPLAAPPTPAGSISHQPKVDDENKNLPPIRQREFIINVVSRTPTPRRQAEHNSIRALTPLSKKVIPHDIKIRINPVLKDLLPITSRNGFLPVSESVKGIRGALIHKRVKERVQGVVRISPKMVTVINSKKSRNNGEEQKATKSVMMMVADTGNAPILQQIEPEKTDGEKEDDDQMTVIENDCDNDYSLIFTSLNKLRR